jgi:hypothetical protein
MTYVADVDDGALPDDIERDLYRALATAARPHRGRGVLTEDRSSAG